MNKFVRKCLTLGLSALFLFACMESAFGQCNGCYNLASRPSMITYQAQCPQCIYRCIYDVNDWDLYNEYVIDGCLDSEPTVVWIIRRSCEYVSGNYCDPDWACPQYWHFDDLYSVNLCKPCVGGTP